MRSWQERKDTSITNLLEPTHAHDCRHRTSIILHDLTPVFGCRPP